MGKIINKIGNAVTKYEHLDSDVETVAVIVQRTMIQGDSKENLRKLRKKAKSRLYSGKEFRKLILDMIQQELLSQSSQDLSC